MRAFAKESKATAPATSEKSTIPGRSSFGPIPQGNSIFWLQRTIGNQAIQRQLPANMADVQEASTAGGLPPGAQSLLPAASKGEGPAEEEFSTMRGDGGGDTTTEEPTAKGEGAKKVKKTELGAPTAGNCGASSWKVRFSVENADETTTGYIVQKVDAKYNRTDCDGKDKPVTGVGTFPFWEAWGVRGGKVFIGDTADAHNADTFSDGSMGDSTKGSIVTKGTPEFFPNVKLPDHMKADNPDTQAHSLRSSTTDPGLSGGTGAISHDITANWNCCPESDKKTTFTDKK